MLRCPTCQAELAPNARFCPKDGTTIRPDTVGVPLAHAATAMAGLLNADKAAGGDRKTTVAGRKPRATTTDPNVDPLIGKLLDGRYRIRARLGEGGVGAVYQAEHVQIKKAVALKVLHPLYASSDEFNRRFEREARSASRLSHPGIVQVLDFMRVDKVESEPGTPAPDAEKVRGTPYLVMEFVRGTLLLDRLIDGPPLSLPEAVAVARDVAAALRHAHGLGIVHRDLKPANLMLLGPRREASQPSQPSGSPPSESIEVPATRVKLLDFGLAKEIEESASEPALTQAGMVFGTPGYLSPEQAAGKKVDARSDLYSLGVILFEMVCNQRLFEREDPLDFVRDHLYTQPRNPRSVNPACSPALAQLILKLLAKSVDERFQSAQELHEALKRVPEATGHTPPAGLRALVDKTVARARATGPLGRPWWQWGTAGGVVILLVAVLVSALHKGPAPVAAPAPPPPVATKTAAPLSAAALHHLDLAESYRRKLWCSDAVEELERAAREDARAAALPEATRIAIGCLTPKTREKAGRFLVERVGPDARGPLEDAAAHDPNSEVRKGAERVLERLR